VTFATIATISSRIFEVVEIVRQTFNPPSTSHSLQVYLDKPKKANISVDPENSNGDEKLLLSNDEAKKLWAGEFVTVIRSDGTSAFSGRVTAIIGGVANSTVWFSTAIPGDVGNGAVVPDSANLLRAPNNITLQVDDAAGKRLRASSTGGLTIDDRIQVVDPYSNTRKILTIKSVDWNNNIITVAEDVSDLKCVSTTQKRCTFRSFRPDVWVKVQAFDSSGNLIDFLADQCSIGPVPPAPVIW
jgi:hypothetical protein